MFKKNYKRQSLASNKIINCQSKTPEIYYLQINQGCYLLEALQKNTIGPIKTNTDLNLIFWTCSTTYIWVHIYFFYT